MRDWEQFSGQNLVVEYKAAKYAAHNSTPGTTIHREAEAIVRELAGRAVIFQIECLLCRKRYNFTVTVKFAAELQGKPRGLCGRHSGPETSTITLIESSVPSQRDAYVPEG